MSKYIYGKVKEYFSLAYLYALPLWDNLDFFLLDVLYAMYQYWLMV